MSAAAPIIGITIWRRHLPTYLGERTDLYTLGAEYAEAVRAAGGIPVLLAPVPSSQVPSLLDRIDGLLLSGGQDLAGSTRGLPAEQIAAIDETDVDQERDAFEGDLLRGAQARSLPVLGICRGVQLTNVALGGTLVQDLAHTETHPVQSTPAEFLEYRHDVAFEPGSDLTAIYGTATRSVNSIHHQALDTVAPELRVSARSADGVIEAAESALDSWYFQGVQWHPEKLTSDAEIAAEKLLLADFISRASSSS